MPSLLEPTWYSDEGTYADIGRSLLHGAVLYRDVWDNKPPGMYWLAAGVIAVAGPGAPAFPVVLAGLVGAGAAAAWILGRRWGGNGAATLAALVLIALMSLPNLEGDLLNAEVVGAVLVLWAVVLVTHPRGGHWRAAGGGALLGLALLFKAVFVFDLVAVIAVPWWAARGAARSWRSAMGNVTAMVAGAAAVLGLAAIALAATGSLGGLVDVLVHQDIDYVQLTNGPRGAVLASVSAGGRLSYTLLLALRVAVPVVAGGAAAWRLSRRGRFWGAVVAWWVGCDLAGVMVSARGFSHYAQQASGAVALGAAMLATLAWRRGRLGRAGAVLAVAATWPLLQLALVAPGTEVAVAHQQRLPPLESGSFHTGQVGRYYRLSWDRLTGRVSQPAYDALFPADLARQRAVVGVFRQYSQPGDRVFVWGTVHWSYALSDRLPAGRYVSLNTAYAVDRAAPARLLAELRAHPPTVLVADIALPPPVLDLVQQAHFRLLPGAAAGADVWLAPTVTP